MIYYQASLFIYSLFSDAVSSSDYITSNYRTIDEHWKG
jgi:hypothetical protein